MISVTWVWENFFLSFFFRFPDCIGDQSLENKTKKCPHLLLWSVAMVTVCLLYKRRAERQRKSEWEMSTQNHTEGHFWCHREVKRKRYRKLKKALWVYMVKGITLKTTCSACHGSYNRTIMLHTLHIKLDFQAIRSKKRLKDLLVKGIKR